MELEEKISEQKERIASMTQAGKRLPRNYVAFVVTRDKGAPKIVSSSRYESMAKEFALTAAFFLFVGVSAGAIVWGGELLAQATGWSVALVVNLARIFAGIWIFLCFYHLAPFLSVLGGLMGHKIILNPDNAQDAKLVRLVERFPGVFSTEWFRAWAEGSVEERDKIYSQLLSLGERYRAASTKLNDLETRQRRTKRDRRHG